MCCSVMFSFFPKPYPDEILYSVFSRYHLRSGNRSAVQTMQDLFNDPNHKATVDLPCRLDVLALNLSPCSMHTVDSLLQNHTLYPFYTVFMPEEKLKQAQQSWHFGNSHNSGWGAVLNRKRGGFLSRPGAASNLIDTPAYFRFCPLCLKQDQQMYGEPYWHRLHQTPGVLVCPMHTVALQVSLVPTEMLSRNQRTYHAASLENCPCDLPAPSYSVKVFEKLLQLATDVAQLMHQPLPCRGQAWFVKQYAALLFERGLGTTTIPKYEELVVQFLSYYGQEFLSVLDSQISADNDGWPFSIALIPTESFHPVRHLLMSRFLSRPIEDIFLKDYKPLPFGKGPWLCLNVCADHYAKPVITELLIDYSGNAEKPVGTFECECGYVYHRIGPDKLPKDKYRIDYLPGVPWGMRA